MLEIIKAKTALISVYNKDRLKPIVEKLTDLGINIISTGGTALYIKKLGIDVMNVEDLTSYPSILGGRVKTLHPKIFGGILNRKNNRDDEDEILKYQIPKINIVIVDLYPFQETVDSGASINDIIEKIDIGGIALIRAAAKNYESVICVSNSNMYTTFLNLLSNLPLNTILLMFIMVWMFTGFAMVVFSAAIKAIPEEIVEAGRIDGATEGRIFLSVIMPYIRSTIIVVATYLTISVLKAFDIVFVTTRGDFESNLLAVKMLDEYFKFLNQGRSASVAVIIFICVIPVILLNVFRNKAENTV